MEYLKVVNWGKFQHYKDRNPPWIKFHTSLLDDYEFQRLPDAAKWQLLLLWLVAARQDNRIPDDSEWLASLFHVFSDDLEIELLVERGWLERIAPDASAKPLALHDSTSAEPQPLDPGACVSTKAVQLQAESETDLRARAKGTPSPDFAETF
jgi:hypothetical protein